MYFTYVCVYYILHVKNIYIYIIVERKKKLCLINGPHNPPFLDHPLVRQTLLQPASQLAVQSNGKKLRKLIWMAVRSGP